MHFSTDQKDDTTVFRLLEERLDSRNAGQLKAEFLILAQPDIQNLIVDLSEVQHIDSAGLSALLLAQRQMTVHEGELRLAGVTGEVFSLLEMTQLDRVFRIFNTVEEAIAAAPIFRDAWERKAWEEEQVLVADPIEPTITGGTGAAVSRKGTASILRAGAIAPGGSLGAAALANIIMNTPLNDELELSALYALGDEEDDDEDDDLDDAFDDDDDFADDLDEEDDVEEEAVEEEADKPEEVIEPEDLDEDFEDDDWDDEELDDDEEDDF
jgi:anti-sigma B factor antagonist